MAQESPLISVIVPVYRVERELSRCVESLLVQSYTRLEILLIDDGSPDGSGALCDRYAAKDNRVRAHHQANAGVSSARNTGIELAAGEFLCFVDSDDEVEPDYIQAFVEGLEEEVDLVFQGICEIRNGKATRKVPPRQLFGSGELTEGISVINRQSMFGYVCNKLYRRSIIMEQGLRFRRDISLSEDRIFALEYMLHVRKMQLVDTCAYNYYLQTTGQTMRLRSYEELKIAADANLQAAHALLQQHPSAAFERDTHRMYVMSAMSFLTALIINREPFPACIRAFCEFKRQYAVWLSLYQPPILDYKALCVALRCPATIGVAIMKLYWSLKHLKHEIAA